MADTPVSPTPIDAAPSPVPQRTQLPPVFRPAADAFVSWQASQLAPQSNALADNVLFNATSSFDSATESAASAVASQVSADDSAEARDISQATANYKGDWIDLAGELLIPASVSHNGSLWLLASDLALVENSEPSDTNTDWKEFQTQLVYTVSAESTTQVLDLQESQVFRVDASVARTLEFANEPGADVAQTAVVHVSGDAAVTWPASIVWDEGEAPFLGPVFTRIVLIWDGVGWTGNSRDRL